MWTKEIIQEKLRSNNLWLERAIVALFKYQTAQEQMIEQAITENNVGFNKPDSRRLSYYAKWINSGRHLTGPHIEIARKKVLKYSGQLVQIANKG